MLAASRLASAVRFFPGVVVLTFGLLMLYGPEPFWDSFGIGYHATGMAMLWAPLGAAMSAFDVYRFHRPSWRGAFPTWPRASDLVLLIAAWNAVVVTLCIQVAAVLGVAVSVVMGASWPTSWWFLVNGVPLVWIGCAAGAVLAAYVHSAVTPFVAGTCMYSLPMLPLRWGTFAFFEPPTAFGPVATYRFAAEQLWLRAGVALVIVAVFCAAGMAMQRVKLAATMFLGAAVLAVGMMAAAHNLGVTSRPPHRAVATASWSCVGDSPRVCVPKGREGYAPVVQRQLSTHHKILRDMDVVPVEQYRMTWQGLENGMSPAGNLGLNAPTTWQGEFSPSKVAYIMASPFTHSDCMERDPTASEATWSLSSWIHDRITEDPKYAGSRETGQPTSHLTTSAQAKDIYERSLACEMGKS